MKKKCHWKMTRHALENRGGACKRFWIKLGSIMPDILVYTYKRGHLFSTTQERTVRTLSKLERKKRWSFVSCYRFGYVLHYLEDYFTFPHNVKGHLLEHCRYEKLFQNKLDGMLDGSQLRCSPSPLPIQEWLEARHREYLQFAKDIETDFLYISQTISEIILRMEQKFSRI